MFDPIYTEPKQCQDCYKCVRECSIKSIRFEGEEKAFIIPDACIYCGHCVDVCPVKAKKIRSDLESVKRWISDGKKVIAAVAPSIIPEFKDINYLKLLTAFKHLGFEGVVEVSAGAQIVTQEVAKYMEKSKTSVHISTACPSVVFLIQKYYPELVPNLLPFKSPALTISSEVKNKYPGVKVVFIGPCIAKMKEADLHPDLIDAAIGFVELKEWIDKEGIKLEELKEISEILIAEDGPGRLYPIDGGMCDTLKVLDVHKSIELLSFSGPNRVKNILDNLDKSQNSKRKIFLELLACEGGCLKGPLASKDKCLIEKIMIQKDMAQTRLYHIPQATISHELKYPPQPIEQKNYSEIEIRKALLQIGKDKITDELNCNGCGHNTCRDFAKAMLSGITNHTMCVSYMRKLANNKANFLIRAMPSALVIVDSDLRVMESNNRFIDLLDEETKNIYNVCGSIQSLLLPEVVPFSHLFESVLNTDEEILDKKVEFNSRVLTVSVFPIERHRIVGGFITDITQPSLQKEHTIKKANELIERNLTTVQTIACLLGENAAETEAFLNSIVKSFSTSSDTKK